MSIQKSVKQIRKISFILILVSFFSGYAVEHSVLVPEIASAWWPIGGNPDLGAYTSSSQQPVDFAVWQAADNTWQLQSCIRATNCGGNTRLFYRWEGQNLIDSNWTPKGIAMEAITSLGETAGGLQAPYVMRENGTYYMYYGDWNRICLASSLDGKTFTRYQNAQGQPALFGGPKGNTRDPMTIIINNQYYCYYTGHDQTGTDYVRISSDRYTWGPPIVVAQGGSSGNGPFTAECPHVVYKQEVGRYYLFRTQSYGGGNISRVYCSTNPVDFGIDNDRYLIGSLPVAAMEIVNDGGSYFIASCNVSLNGINLARLNWTSHSLPAAPQNLQNISINGAGVGLVWTSLPAAVKGYAIYRNDTLIGESTDATFIDTSAQPEKSYQYAVAAIDQYTQEGPNSAQITVATPRDTIAPKIILVSAYQNDSTITLVFDEPVNAADAQSITHYLIDGSITVKAAVLKSDNKTVVLTVDPLTSGTLYTLTAQNIRDQSAAQNACGILTKSFIYQTIGQGLRGVYFNSISLTDSITSRIDSVIQFNWGTGSPLNGVKSDSFSVRWSGSILAPVSGVYTFYANTNDGARLWVNAVKVIDNWIAQPLTESNGTITMQAGERYPITFEYFENVNTAQVELRWSCAGLAKEIIPKAFLFPLETPTAVFPQQTIKTSQHDFIVMRAVSGAKGVTSIDVSICLIKPAHLRAVLCSMQGKTVAVLAEGMQQAGQHRIIRSVGSLPGGIYIVNLFADGAPVASQSILLTR